MPLSESSSLERRPKPIPGTMNGVNTGPVAPLSSAPTGTATPNVSAVPSPSSGFENPSAGRSATDTTFCVSVAV